MKKAVQDANIIFDFSTKPPSGFTAANGVLES